MLENGALAYSFLVVPGTLTFVGPMAGCIAFLAVSCFFIFTRAVVGTSTQGGRSRIATAKEERGHEGEGCPLQKFDGVTTLIAMLPAQMAHVPLLKC